jgi:hypothetical protein
MYGSYFLSSIWCSVTVKFLVSYAKPTGQLIPTPLFADVAGVSVSCLQLVYLYVDVWMHPCVWEINSRLTLIIQK